MVGARRVFADAERGRDLGETELLLVAEQDDLPLPIGQLAQRRVEAGQLLGALDPQETVAFRRRNLLAFVGVEPQRPLRQPEPPCSPDRDPEEPGPQRRRGAELPEGAIGLQEDVLEQVVRVERTGAAGQPLAEGEQRPLVAIDDPLEGRLVARDESAQIVFVVAGHFGGLGRYRHRAHHHWKREEPTEPRVKSPEKTDAVPGAAPTTGRVFRIDRKQIHVELTGDRSGRLLPCTLRGRMFETMDDDSESRPVAVGDRVRVAIDGEQATIEEIFPRTSRIARPRPRSPESWQVIAANVDLLGIVASLGNPATKPGLVDRLLVTAESESIEPLIVLNKVDLVTPAEADAFAAPYRELGYRVLLTSAPGGGASTLGIDALRDVLRTKTAMLLGHSGVGKSSLLRALDPSIATRVGALVAPGTKMARGAHTTTAAMLHRLDLSLGLDPGLADASGTGEVMDAWLVDTPGVREFGLPPMEPHDLAHWFREMRPLIAQCKYATCIHDPEPGCAVKAAAERGSIRPERFATYKKLLAELQGGGERMQRHDAY